MKLLPSFSSRWLGLGMLLFLCLTASSAEAQPYRSAIGLRLGYPTSVSVKHFLSENNAIEAYVGTRGFSSYRWFNVSAAYLRHQSLYDVVEIENLSWYVGAGATAYFWTFDFASGSETVLGVQGYLGLDYAFEDIPLNLTLDWVPTLFLNSRNFFGISRSAFGADYGSLGVRYVFNR